MIIDCLVSFVALTVWRCLTWVMRLFVTAFFVSEVAYLDSGAYLLPYASFTIWGNHQIRSFKLHGSMTQTRSTFAKITNFTIKLGFLTGFTKTTFFTFLIF